MSAVASTSTLWQVAASLVLVAIASAISLLAAAPTSSATSAIAVVRSFVQLTAIGYVIKLIFDADTIWLVLALLAVMVLFGALTARGAGQEGARTPSGRC